MSRFCSGSTVPVISTMSSVSISSWGDAPSETSGVIHINKSESTQQEGFCIWENRFFMNVIPLPVSDRDPCFPSSETVSLFLWDANTSNKSVCYLHHPNPPVHNFSYLTGFPGIRVESMRSDLCYPRGLNLRKLFSEGDHQTLIVGKAGGLSLLYQEG